MRDPVTCRHVRQRVFVLRDFNREQRCVTCGALVFRLPPVDHASDAELLTEAERRRSLLLAGWPLTPNPPKR
jgi:hypothetical protein